MRITSRLLILFIAVSFAFLAYFYLFVHYKNTETSVYLDYDQVQRKQTIDAIFRLKKSAEFNVLSDYRSREDLLLYCQTKDEAWADANLKPIMDSYNFSLVQIYDYNKKLIFSEHNERIPALEKYFLEPEMLDSLKLARSMDYSLRFGSNLLSITAGTIHRTEDSLSTSPYGYMLVGQIWDNRFFQDMAKTLNYNLNITITKPSPETKVSNRYDVRMIYPVNDWKGNTVLWLNFYVVNNALKEVQSLGKQVIFATGGFILLFLLIQFILIEQWISIPLSTISKSLKENRLDILHKLNDTKTEFSDVAHLIEQFFEQRINLRREIETREKTQIKLREIEEQTLTIFLTSPESIILTDLEGKLVTANQETYALLQMPYELYQDLAIDLKDHVSPSSLETLEKMIQDLLEGELVRNREIEICRLDGVTFPALISASVVYDAEQQPSRLIFIARDLTEIKALEQQLLQAQKMESLGTLAGGIAHDFNNIMTIIAGYIAISSAKLTGSTDAQDDLDEALKACIRAKNLISKILSFSRSTEQEVQSISLADVLAESLPMIRASIPTIISINTEISSYRDVLADPTEIQQILLNLSTNSFHAMQRKGGILSFKIKELSGFELIGLDPAVKLNQDYLQLSVEDTGCGIPPDMLPRIFDPYFSTKSTGEGTGLGLAIVHGIVKNAGGFISVHSEVEVGTVFNLYFPIVEAVRPPKTQPKIVDPPFNPAHILFVDDEQALTELFSEALCSEGYTVEITSDSEVALELFRANPEKYNLIIADVTMPHLDGIKLAGLIREINNVPIILYSGYSVYNLRTEIHEVGVNRLLSKPILPMDMVTNVREVMAEIKFTREVLETQR